MRTLGLRCVLALAKITEFSPFMKLHVRCFHSIHKSICIKSTRAVAVVMAHFKIPTIKTKPRKAIAKRARSKNRLHIFGPPARLRQMSACSIRGRGNVGEVFLKKSVLAASFRSIWLLLSTAVGENVLLMPDIQKNCINL